MSYGMILLYLTYWITYNAMLNFFYIPKDVFAIMYHQYIKNKNVYSIVSIYNYVL